MLSVIETNFINSKRGEMPKGHREIYKKAVNLMTSKQMEAFKVAEESQETKDAYGTGGFGQGLLMARRLGETGGPFVLSLIPIRRCRRRLRVRLRGAPAR